MSLDILIIILIAFVIWLLIADTGPGPRRSEQARTKRWPG